MSCNISCLFYIHSVGGNYERNIDMISTALSSLKAYDQRLMFASGRLEMLKGMFCKSCCKVLFVIYFQPIKTLTLFQPYGGLLIFGIMVGTVQIFYKVPTSPLPVT